MVLATAAELAAWLGHPGFDTTEQARAELLLNLATAEVQGADGTDQALEVAAQTQVRDGTGTCKLVLPRHPVTAVATVTVDDGTTVTTLTFDDDYTWSESGILTRISGVWPCRDRAVTITYTAGWATIPAEVKKICLRLASTAWHNPIGADSEQIGDRDVRWHTPGMELSSTERDTLSRYRGN